MTSSLTNYSNTGLSFKLTFTLHFTEKIVTSFAHKYHKGNKLVFETKKEA